MNNRTNPNWARRAAILSLLLGMLLPALTGGAEEAFTHRIKVSILGFLIVDGDYQEVWKANERYHEIGMKNGKAVDVRPDHSFRYTRDEGDTKEILIGSFTPDMQRLVQLRYEYSSFARHNKWRESVKIHLENIPLAEVGTKNRDGQQTIFGIVGNAPDKREQIGNAVKSIAWELTTPDGKTIRLQSFNWKNAVDKPEIYMKPVGIGALSASYQIPVIRVDVYEFFTAGRKASANQSGKRQGKTGSPLRK